MIAQKKIGKETNEGVHFSELWASENDFLTELNDFLTVKSSTQGKGPQQVLQWDQHQGI